MRRRGRGCGRRASTARRILYTARMATVPKPDPANFRLSVKDFGPIVEADVDFRPLTVFVGPSNTGKSYMAVLAYALHQVLMEEPIEVRVRRYLPSGMRRFLRDIPHRDVQAIQAWAKQPDSTTGDQVNSPEFEKIIKNGLENYFYRLREGIVAELLRCFGFEDIEHFHRNPKKSGAQIHFYKGDNGYETTLTQGSREETRIVIPSIPPFSIDRDMQRSLGIIRARNAPESSELQQFAIDIAEAAIDSIFPQVIGAINQPIYYLPADRTGIMHAHQVVVSALLERAQYGGVRRDARVGVLSGVLGDFLQHLIELERPMRRRGGHHLKTTATDLETKVLKGAIHNIPSEAGYPSFFYRPDGWKDDLSLMNASSMVSELAPVVLFLRHIVQRNDVLIIEEPESHLHPEMQVEFTRVLAGAVNSGLRVILTTHSEWIVETVGNLVELSNLPKRQRESLLGGPYALPAEDVGVWLFRPKRRPRGSVVEEVVRDPDTGVYGVGYDEVAMVLHNEWANAARESE